MPEPTATAARLLATPEAFRAWLAGKCPGEVIGRAWDECGYPLAVFLRQMTGTAYRTTGSVWYLPGASPNYPWENDEEEDMPGWAATFIHEIDQYREHTPITATLALQALDRATATGEAQP